MNVLKVFMLRSAIVVFWIAVGIGLLSIPRLTSWLSMRFERPFITVFTWGNMFDIARVRAFEKETGIKVFLNFYTTNEELHKKLLSSQGDGYDLIIPSDYAVEKLKKEGLLKKIDKSKITFLSHINQHLLNLPFDQHNEYTVPWAWELYGLGVNVDYFAQQRNFRGLNKKQVKNFFENKGWGALFDCCPQGYSVVMTSDPLEIFSFGALYLRNRGEELGPQYNNLLQLLVRQRSWVEAYSSFRADYFLITGNSPLAVTTTAQMWQGIKNNDAFEFIVPQEGTYATIENFALPGASKKDDLVYAFINYMSSPESVVKHFEKFSFFPACESYLDSIELDVSQLKLRAIAREHQQKLMFFKAFLSDQEKYRLWVALKATRS
ncbi:MAG: Extracellular solute-binding protein family 1 [candidate division TM6 bacterium GW2011_GWE2_41_16]|nr:MAG: Extracellular solute-binding protein family 1 [candidate division TM6 bacterium GW2011_GWE2_41_16]